ncbi:MAG: apolipoprotein N-acyltransferase [Gammaproteobacteria bacterium]
MFSTLSTPIEFLKNRLRIKRFAWLLLVCTGMLLPLGFAPFHMPGAAILGLSLFYNQIQRSKPHSAFFRGLAFGLGYFGLGISWVSISIHSYGHINFIFASLITGLLVFYLALFPALCAFAFRFLSTATLSHFKKAILFTSLWTISEYLRSICFTGFPWLSLGFGQIDTPLKYALPILGIYGIGYLAILAACCLTHAVYRYRESSQTFPSIWLFSFIFMLIAPAGLKHIQWSTIEEKSWSIGVVQANLSMRDKWDETLFWNILEHYQDAIQELINKKQIIILPESAIPLPVSYIQDFLSDLDKQAKKHHTALLFGIPEEINPEKNYFYNTLTGLGTASGIYRKQHLVPFGEYIPTFFEHILLKLNLDLSNLRSYRSPQTLVKAHDRPFASLICYELAYPGLLRQQLPEAQWIISLSDDGWFGHSLASYQHLQMAQALSLLTSRYQIVANNDGLSSIITPQGLFTHSLPAFTSGILEGEIHAAHGTTPWIYWGDAPVLGLCILGVLFSLYERGRAHYKNKYSVYQPF